MLSTNLSSSMHIGVIGLGYVGLPIALTCSNHYRTTGFDNSSVRIESLTQGIDNTGEIEEADFTDKKNLSFTIDAEDLRGCDIILVTVPTPIDAENRPDLSLLRTACATVGSILESGTTVVFESTVYPGVTEEVCLPILEDYSGLRVNQDFWLGYSPERINPGDKAHRLKDVIKVTAGSNPAAADFIDDFYRSIVPAGTFKASSIRVAEAAKVIENIQRDLNIALVNEFAMLFDQLQLDTGEVLAAASTKWNFLPFQPGLVGGHCIGVDPYYLTHKAYEVGFNPEVILAGRKINNAMPEWIADKTVSLLHERGQVLSECQILVFGITFKENCPDTRNSKTVELVRALRSKGAAVDVFDPVATVHHSDLPPDIELRIDPPKHSYDVLLIAVAHEEFRTSQPDQVLAYGKQAAIVYDLKHVLPKNLVTTRL